MLKNYILITIRTLMRQKVYSFINIAGLAIGIAGFILISLWVFNELSFDEFHEKKDRLFRVNTITTDYGLAIHSSWRLGPALVNTYPEIEDFTRLWPYHRSLVKFEDKVFNETNFYLADPSFFTMFTLPFKYGTAETALKDKNSLVLTEETAQRYFGDINPVGKLLYVRRYDQSFRVSGVIKNIPQNSSIRFDLMGRVDLMPKQRLESWEFTGFTCVLISENVNVDEVNKKIAGFYKEYVNPANENIPYLQPLTQIHLYELGTPGLIKQIYLFSIIAIFILLIACINFMNLSTAHATKRAREVGIRKVVGAYRRQLIQQFLGESTIISFLSLILAMLFIEISLPFFNEIVQRQLTLFSDQFVNNIIFLIGTTFLTGILAGSYPAFYLSSFQAANILKGIKASGRKTQIFRRMLTIFQFAISIGLIASTYIFHQQLDFIHYKDLGLKRDLVISLANNSDLSEQFDVYKNELLNSGLIEYVTASATIPFNVGQYIEINWEGHYDKEGIPTPYTMVDYDYFKTFDMHFVSGRAFSKDFTTDETEACIINQTTANLMGFENPIGKEVYFNHPAFEESFKMVKIIGVVNDFHSRSLHKSIGPFIFRMYKPWHSYVYLKVKPGNLQAAITEIKKITRKLAPDYPVEFEFLDETYNRIYIFEKIMGKVFNVFAFLAIFVSCLGLLGLASFTVEQRTKEIGIRKVLGASVSSIVTMLSKEFTKWVLIANLIAWPLAAYFMNEWLDNFVYKIGIEWWVFVLAAGIALVIALLTVSSQALKAAVSNPVETLRYE